MQFNTPKIIDCLYSNLYYKNLSLIVISCFLCITLSSCISNRYDNDQSKEILSVRYGCFLGHASVNIIKLSLNGMIEVRSNRNNEHITKKFKGEISEEEAQSLLKQCHLIESLPHNDQLVFAPGDFPLEFILHYNDGSSLKRNILEDELAENEELCRIRKQLLEYGRRVISSDTQIC